MYKKKNIRNDISFITTTKPMSLLLMLPWGFGSNDGKFFSERQREIFTKDSGGGGGWSILWQL